MNFVKIVEINQVCGSILNDNTYEMRGLNG